MTGTPLALPCDRPPSDPLPAGTVPSAPARPGGLRRVAAISTSLVGTQAATSVLGLFFWAVAARQSSVAEIGVAAAAVALMMLLGSIGTLGLGTLLISRLPHTAVGTRRLLVRTCLLVCGATAGALAVVVPSLIVGVFDAGNLRPVVATVPDAALLGAGTALMAITMVVDQAVLVFGVGRLQLERNLVASSVKLVALLLLGRLGARGGMDIFLAWTVGSAVSLPWLAWRTRGGRALQDHGRLVDLRALRGLAREAAGHHLLNIALQTPLQLLPAVVTVVLSARDNGIFSTAVLVTGFVFALPYAVTVGLFAAAEGDEHQIVSRLRFTVPFGLVVSVLADLLLIPLATPVLHIFGAQYANEGTTVLRVLVLAGVPFVIKDHFIALRRVQGRTWEATAVFLAFALLEVGGAAWGARHGGLDGLCATWLAVLFLEAALLAYPLIRAARVEDDGSRPSAGPQLDGPPGRAAGLPRLRWVGGRRDVVAAGADRTALTVLAMSTGLLLVAVAAARARLGTAGLGNECCYAAGLTVIFVTPTVRILSRSAGAAERIRLAVAMPVMLQLTQLMLHPTHFVYHDELIHLNVLRTIDSTGHLFGPNPLLPVAGYYPALETATHVLSQVTGLPEFPAACAVLMLSRLVLVLAVILVARVLTGSQRVACLAGVLYSCNPQMIFFNAQFSYQTLALPLAALAAYLFLTRPPGGLRPLGAPLLTTLAVAASHHLTSMLLVAFWWAWLGLEVTLRHRRRPDTAGLAVLAAGGSLAVAALLANPGNPVLGYLGDIVTSSVGDLLGFLAGRQTKALFKDSAGQGSLLWEQIFMIGSVLLLSAALPCGLSAARVWWRRRHSCALLLSLVALLYPLVPSGHLTRATAEVGDRSAGFIFVGVAFVLAPWVHRWRPGRLSTWCAATAGTITFLGGVILGAGPMASQLPGPYLISADARTIDSDNLSAAFWLRANVPPGSRVYANRVTGLLAASVGGQYTVRHVSTGIDASRLLLDPEFTDRDVDLIRQAALDYVIVDLRDAYGLPHRDVYIEFGEFGPPARTSPVPAAALSKLAAVPGVDRVYDNGSIVVYDVRRLRGHR